MATVFCSGNATWRHCASEKFWEENAENALSHISCEIEGLIPPSSGCVVIAVILRGQRCLGSAPGFRAEIGLNSRDFAPGPS